MYITVKCTKCSNTVNSLFNDKVICNKCNTVINTVTSTNKVDNSKLSKVKLQGKQFVFEYAL